MLGGTLKYCQLWKVIFNLETALNVLCSVWYIIMSRSYNHVMYKTKCVIPTNKELLLVLIVYWKVGKSALSPQHYMTNIYENIFEVILKKFPSIWFTYCKNVKKIQEGYNSNVDYLESLFQNKNWDHNFFRTISNVCKNFLIFVKQGYVHT